MLLQTGWSFSSTNPAPTYADRSPYAVLSTKHLALRYPLPILLWVMTPSITGPFLTAPATRVLTKMWTPASASISNATSLYNSVSIAVQMES